MKHERPMLLSTEALRELAARALSLLAAVPEPAWELDEEDAEVDDEDAREEARDAGSLRRQAAIDAMRFVASASVLQPDPRLLVSLAEAATIMGGTAGGQADHEALARAIGAAVAAGATIDATVEALAGSPDASVRCAVARGLSPGVEGALSLLERLSLDRDPMVRKLAQSTLTGASRAPWWVGRWKRDPLAWLPAGEAVRVGAAVSTISAILDGAGPLSAGQVQALSASCAAVPDALCVEVLEGRLTHAAHGDPVSRSIGALMVTRQGGPEALVRIVRAWRDPFEFVRTDDLAGYLLPLPGARRSAIALDLARRALADGDDPSRSGGATRALASIAALVYPDGEHLGPLLDLLLETQAGARQTTIGALLLPFFRVGANVESVAERVGAACAAGFPGAWQPVCEAMLGLLDRAPITLRREVALLALGTASLPSLRWAIGQLLGPSWDAARDPARPLVLARFFEHPPHRSAILSSEVLAQSACALLRAELRAGRLDAAAAWRTITATGHLYGGLLSMDEPWARAKAARARDQRARLRSLRDLLGGKPLQGPPTDEEWSRYRAARDGAAALDRQLFCEALGTLPDGPLECEDRAFFARARDLWRAGDAAIGDALVNALAAAATSAEVPWLSEIAERGDPDGFVREARQRAMARLDLDIAPPPRGESGRRLS